MSTAPPQNQANAQNYVDFDEYIDFQVEKTRTGIKWADILTAGTGVLTLTLGYLLLFVVFDHWVIEGGFGNLSRVLMLGLLFVGSIAWIVWKMVLPYNRQINSLYAAQAIEQAEPSLKNALLNLIDLNRANRPVSEEIRTTMEKRAATTLTNVDVEEAVDRKPLLRLSYALLAIVVLGSLYTLFSPKKPWPSISAALLPAAERTYATRTEITDVQPGDVELLARETLEVTALIRGEIPEKVSLLYTTQDKKYVNEAIPMRATDETGKSYRGVLLGENGRGLLQNLTYRVVAGDAESSEYSVKVNTPPAATISEVKYIYPTYMELPPRALMTGHIDAWEGTMLTINAIANQELTQAAIIPLDRAEFTQASQGVPIPMEISQKVNLTVRFKAEFRPDGSVPHFYAIQCRNAAGETDPSPTLYRLNIRPDKPPEFELVEPASDISAPANAIIPVRVVAHDPDFKLSYITLKAELKGEELPGTPILFDGSIRNKQQRYSGKAQWNLQNYELQPGDVVSYWIEARDNKLPLPNRRNTPKLKIQITKPVSPEEVKKQLQQEEQKQEERAKEQQQENQQDNKNSDNKDDEDQSKENKEKADSGKSDNPEEGDKGKEEGEQKQNNEEGSEDKAGDKSGQSKEGGQEKADEQEAIKKLIERNQQKSKQEQKDSSNSEDKQPGDKSQEGNKPNSQGPNGSQKKEGDQQGNPGAKPGNEDQDNKSKPGDSTASGEGKKSSDPDSEQPKQQGNTDGGKKSPNNNKGNATKKGDNTQGTEKPADDSPDAKKMKGTGDETGEATPDNDPNAKPTQAKNPDKIKRKPGEKPNIKKRNGEGNPEKPNQKKQGSNKPENADPAAKQKNKPQEQPKSDKSNENKKPNGAKRPSEKKEGQPEGSNEPPKGDGRPQKQKSDRPQEGEKGGSQKSDEGNKGSNKSGKGDKGQKPGDKQAGKPSEKNSDSKPQAGKPGDKKGPGSKSQASEQKSGNKPGNKPGEGKSPNQSNKKSAGGSKSQQPGTGQGQAGNKPNQGQGNPGSGKHSDSGGSGGAGSEAASDEANLEFAKKATDLALKRLENELQRGEVDEDLLKELGWTKEEMQKFSKRIRKELNKQGQSENPREAAQSTQFNEMLKALNLKGGNQNRAGKDDRIRNLKGISDRRLPVPAEYREVYDAYTRSLSKKNSR